MTNDQKAVAIRREKIRDLLAKSKNQFTMALPRHLTADRLIQVAMTGILRDPRLLDCDQRSLLRAIMEAAQLGLVPDGILGHAYLVPFNTKRGLMCTLIVGYKGLLDLARRSGNIMSIQAHVVYEADQFEYAYGLADTLVHRPALTGRGRPIATYAAALLSDGGHAFEVMSVEDINRIRDNSQSYQAAKKYNKESAWDTHWDEMARKTLVRRLSKYLPLSVEMARAVATSEAWEGHPVPELGMELLEEEPIVEMEAIEGSPQAIEMRDEVQEDASPLLIRELVNMCPATEPEPPDEDLLASYVRAGAAAQKISQRHYVDAAMGNPAAFFEAFLPWAKKKQPVEVEKEEESPKASHPKPTLRSLIAVLNLKEPFGDVKVYVDSIAVSEGVSREYVIGQALQNQSGFRSSFKAWLTAQGQEAPGPEMAEQEKMF